MKKCMQKVAKKEGLQRLRRRQAFTTLFQFIPVLDRWANLLVFPVKPSVYLFSIRKPRACQKLGNGPGVGKCPAPGQCKICKCPTPGTDKAGKCPAVARGGGGWLGACGIDWCIMITRLETNAWMSVCPKRYFLIIFFLYLQVIKRIGTSLIYMRIHWSLTISVRS